MKLTRHIFTQGTKRWFQHELIHRCVGKIFEGKCQKNFHLSSCLVSLRHCLLISEMKTQYVKRVRTFQTEEIAQWAEYLSLKQEYWTLDPQRWGNAGWIGGPHGIPGLGRQRWDPEASWLDRLDGLESSGFKSETLPQYIRQRLIKEGT